MLDPCGHIVSWNSGAERIKGYREEEILGKHFSVLYTEEDVERDHPEEELRLAVAEGRYEEEGLRVRKDGSKFWANVLITALWDEAGNLRGFSKVTRDITERKQAEQKLRESEERYRTLYEETPAMYFTTDARGTTLSVNRFGAQRLGYAAEELVGQSVLDVVHEGDKEVGLQHITTCSQDPAQLCRGEFRKVRKDGSIMWVEETARAVQGPDGDAVILVVCEDITEHKRAEQRLATQYAVSRILIEVADPEYAFPKILNAIGEGLGWDYGALWVMDPQDYVLRCVANWHASSAEFFQFRKVSQETDFAPGIGLPGRVWSSGEATWISDIATDANFPRLQAAASEGLRCGFGSPVLLGGQALGVLEFLSREPRELDRDLLEAMTTIGSQIGQFIERRRTREAMREIREAERRRISRDLHDMVLQDLVSALQSLQLSHAQSKSTGAAITLEQEIEALRRAGQGLRGAIHDLRLDKQQPLARGIQALVELNRQMVPKREIDLVVQEGFPEELPETVRAELLRVVQEALTNVRRHSGARRVEVKLWKEGGEVHAEVVDDGRGFDPEAVREGVGLSGMRERIAALGGKLEVSSELGKGTRVAVSVPV